MRTWGRPAAVAAMAAAAAALACRGGLSDADAEALVRRYDALVSDAYRAGDYRIAQPVIGDEEARRLAGHIGARLDQGLTLDSKLLDLALRGIERPGGEVIVTADERWYYLDRRIGTGEQVGQDSRDRYTMRYHLKRADQRWVVDRTEFASRPQVGRTEVPNKADVRTMHGMEAGGDAPAPAAPGARTR